MRRRREVVIEANHWCKYLQRTPADAAAAAAAAAALCNALLTYSRNQPSQRCRRGADLRPSLVPAPPVAPPPSAVVAPARPGFVSAWLLRQRIVAPAFIHRLVLTPDEFDARVAACLPNIDRTVAPRRFYRHGD